MDLQIAVGATNWSTAHKAFMRRHVLAHRSGVVDQQYVDETGDCAVAVGRRLVISPADVLGLTEVVADIGKTLLALLPPAK